jgi:hypothetical protein
MLGFGTDLLVRTTTNNTVLTGYAPFTLSINPSAMSFFSGRKIYKIEYIFDNLEKKVQSLFIAPTGNTNLAFNFEVGDPRNYKQQKTFYLPNVYKKDYQIEIKMYTVGVFNPTTISFYLSLSAPVMDGTLNGFFSSVNLVHSRMFGIDNNILYVFETKNPNYFIPVIFNWKSRPIVPEPIIIDDGYRPFRLFEPYEDQKSTNIYTNIDFVNEQGNYDDAPKYPHY